MTQPLALIFYEKLLPGSQLVNRMQDLGYRVLTASNADRLLAYAKADKPMLVLADLAPRRTKMVETIALLRKDPETTHLPVIAFVEEKDATLQNDARAAGATLVASDAAILNHLEHFLEQALRLD